MLLCLYILRTVLIASNTPFNQSANARVVALRQRYQTMASSRWGSGPAVVTEGASTSPLSPTVVCVSRKCRSAIGQQYRWSWSMHGLAHARMLTCQNITASLPFQTRHAWSINRRIDDYTFASATKRPPFSVLFFYTAAHDSWWRHYVLGLSVRACVCPSVHQTVNMIFRISLRGSSPAL